MVLEVGLECIACLVLEVVELALELEQVLGSIVAEELVLVLVLEQEPRNIVAEELVLGQELELVGNVVLVLELG